MLRKLRFIFSCFFLGKQNGELSKDEYVIFWTEIQQTDKSACEVLRCLIQELIAITEAKKPVTSMWMWIFQLLCIFAVFFALFHAMLYFPQFFIVNWWVRDKENVYYVSQIAGISHNSNPLFGLLLHTLKISLIEWLPSWKYEVIKKSDTNRSVMCAFSV